MCSCVFTIIMFTIAALFIILIMLIVSIFLSELVKLNKTRNRCSHHDRENNDNAAAAAQHLLTNYYFSDETFKRNSLFLSKEGSLDLIKNNLFVKYNTDTASTKL